MAKVGFKFMELLEGSVILQGCITLLIVGAFVYTVAVALPVPDNLERAMFLVLGYYFGSKVHVSGRKMAERAASQAVDKFAQGSSPSDG